jgi:nucleoside-diphosphate-sugar epimerase
MSNFWTKKKVLVTGGASFIGSHLVESLLGRGAEVHVADDLSSGRLENLDGVLDRIEFTEADLKERSTARNAVRGMQVVFHLAAQHGGRGYIDTHPANCAANMALDGTVFEAAAAANVERICFASSACVYPVTLQEEGSGTIYLREEQADPFKPGAALADGEYGWAKLMGEMALRAYYKQYGIKSACCRIFTAYGERENETHAVIALIAKAFVKMDPYVVWGTGEQDRNFTYVGDIVEGLIRACERIEDGSPVNVGTAEHIKIIDSVHMICELTGFTPETIARDTTKPVGVFSRAADLTRARSLLGWEPQTSFRDGLSRTIKWYFAHKDPADVAARLGVLLIDRKEGRLEHSQTAGD